MISWKSKEEVAISIDSRENERESRDFIRKSKEKVEISVEKQRESREAQPFPIGFAFFLGNFRPWLAKITRNPTS